MLVLINIIAIIVALKSAFDKLQKIGCYLKIKVPESGSWGVEKYLVNLKIQQSIDLLSVFMKNIPWKILIFCRNVGCKIIKDFIVWYNSTVEISLW